MLHVLSLSLCRNACCERASSFGLHEVIVLEHTLRRDNMSSSDNDGLPSVDSELIHSQDLLRSSDFERSSESAHIDDNSEEIASMHLTKELCLSGFSQHQLQGDFNQETSS